MNLFWHRRDLRFSDNAGLYQALKSGMPVQPIFIFDPEILEKLKNPTDARVSFIHQRLTQMQSEYQKLGADLWVFYGKPLDVFKELFQDHKIEGVFTNQDYEPSAISRDLEIESLCAKNKIDFKAFKDQVIFEKSEILSDSRKPYTVFTPYKKKWLKSVSPFYFKSYPTEEYKKNLAKQKEQKKIPSLKEMGFSPNTETMIPPAKVSESLLKNYAQDRDFPALAATSLLGLHLRFGTLSIRKLAVLAKKHSEVWLSELIWREFFMQILFHFPHVEKSSFRPDYEKIKWRESPEDFKKWCEGKTGYPMVDAGMRELNATGFMHNRVRMVTASFLAKHLLLHWYQGERYFAEKLLDYELSANNGNWQWAAGTGCDAAPYFRVFNPEAQQKRFDPEFKYIKKWIPEFGTEKYPKPMVVHEEARARALLEYKKGLNK